MHLQLFTWQKASDLPPPPHQYVPNSLNLKIRFIQGNPWLGGFCSLLHQELKITWGGQELIRKSDFPCNRTGKCPLYFMDWKRTGFHWYPVPVSSVSWPLRGAPVLPPRHLVGPGAIYQREVIQEKTNLLICSINLSCLTLRQGSWFNTSCSEVSCWWAEGWGQSVGRKWKQRHVW